MHKVKSFYKQMVKLIKTSLWSCPKSLGRKDTRHKWDKPLAYEFEDDILLSFLTFPEQQGLIFHFLFFRDN